MNERVAQFFSELRELWRDDPQKAKDICSLAQDLISFYGFSESADQRVVSYPLPPGFSSLTGEETTKKHGIQARPAALLFRCYFCNAVSGIAGFVRYEERVLAWRAMKRGLAFPVQGSCERCGKKNWVYLRMTAEVLSGVPEQEKVR